MPFPFSYVCDLLEELERHVHEGGAKSIHRDIVTKWFARHRRRIDHPDTDLPALFSTLIPEQRADRVYGTQAPSLQKIIGRALCLGVSRIQDLRQHEQPGGGRDLADCVFRVLTETPNPSHSEGYLVTVEDVDALLNALAASCRFSSPAIRSLRPASGLGNRDDLGRLYTRMSAQEAKWLTRLVLKSYTTIALPADLVYKCYDGRFPMVLKVNENFEVALNSLRTLRATNPLGLGNLLQQVKPKLGVKVGRQSWLQGRSIKHCLDFGHKRVSCEKKMDGEYCQIHVDLSKGLGKCIQIFSKSSKDSTRDRSGIHQAVRDSLRIGRPDCKIARGCILEGELLAYNNRERKVQPFHKIRKHVTRSGVSIAVDQDSPPDPDEHLMIVYFDVLLVDDESLLHIRQTERFRKLSSLIECRSGHAELVERQVIDLDQRLGASNLRRAFAKCIAAREEGLVLKPDDPYFPVGDSPRRHMSSPIKLKKEYIGGFGDVGDFAVVGARYDAAKAKSYHIDGLQWTHFFLACLNNRDAVRCHQAKPAFNVVDEVELNATQLRTVKSYGNPLSVPFEDNNVLDLTIPQRMTGDKCPTVVFTNPLVFDVRCFSFERPGNAGFWTPRFPQVSKIHFDRSYEDTITYSGLQEIAENARSVPEVDFSQDIMHWVAALEGADPRGIPVDAASQLTVSTIMTPSPVSSKGWHSQSTVKSPVSVRKCSTLLQRLQNAVGTAHASSAPDLEAGAGKEQESVKAIATSPTESTAGKKKRIQGVSVSAQSNKRQKLSMAAASTTSSNIPPCQSPPRSERNTCKSRDPLATLDINSSPIGTRVILPQPCASISTREEMMAEATHSSSDAQDRHSAASSVEAAPSKHKNTCQHAGRRCTMRGRKILLAPCIANQLYITEDLLPVHGVSHWITDLRNLVKYPTMTLQQATPTPTHLPPATIPGRHPRLTCLVEGRRKDATRSLMKDIEKCGPRLPDGSRHWVEIWDWRVLEDIKLHERKFRGSQPRAKQTDPWRKRYYIGLA